MALSSELTKFKAPGVKILTTVAQNTPQAVAPRGARVLLINSRKGPVNQLVLVNTFVGEYNVIFDDISDADERRGSFGAVSAQIMLDAGPIYVLNLRTFDNTLDLAGLQEFSTNPNVVNATSKNVPYASLYNTQQLWKIDPNQLLKSTNTTNLLVFANIGTSNLSIIVRQTRTVQSTLTFEKWYANLSKPMPSYVNPNDKVSDWIVDVLVFDNQFNASSSTNNSYGYCFNVDGSIKKTVVNSSNVEVDGVTQLSRIAEAGYLTTITGSLVSGFVDQYGNNFDVVALVNNSIQRLGLVAKINDQIYDNAAIWQPGESNNSDGMKKIIPVDLLGHNLCHITSVGTFDATAYEAIDHDVKSLSYSYTTSLESYNMNLDQFVQNTDIVPNSSAIQLNALIPGKLNTDGDEISILNKNTIYVNDSFRPSLGDAFVSVDGNLAKVVKINIEGTQNKINGYGTILAPVQPFGLDAAFAGSHGWEVPLGGANTFVYPDAGKPFPKDLSNSYFVYPSTHKLTGKALAFDAVTGSVVHNPNAASIGNGDYVFQKDISGQNIPTSLTGVTGYTPGTSQLIQISDISEERVKASDVANSTTLLQGLFTAFGSLENIYSVTFDKQLVFNKTLQSVEVNLDPIAFDADKHTIQLSNGKTLYSYNDTLSVFKIKSDEQMSTKFVPVNLKSYVPRQAQFVDGTADRQSAILDQLLSTSIRNGLQNRDLFNWTYLVDGFKSYIGPQCKFQLRQIAEDRILARAIYNMPSIYDFAKSTNPYFKSTQDGDFEPRYIALGGNTELPYSNLFSLPSENGWFAYGFGPNLIASGRSIPPAAAVSNNFARKYINNKPYAILAGLDGIISARNVSDVEHVFNEKNDGTGDRDYLDPFGYNVILKKQSGLQIYGNKTSSNVVSTPMSAIHTSEVVMYIQGRINSVLEKYVFKYNTAPNRLVIKSQADDICDEPLGDGAISGYVNQMDEFNNTAEVISSRIGILDTRIFDNSGMEILVHRTYVDTITNLATFEILSSNQ